MRGSSELFSVALAASHTVSATVSAFYEGTAQVADIPISDGTLEYDATQLIRGSLSISVPRYFTPPDGIRRDLLPVGDTDALGCNGQRLALSYTISRPGRGTETISMGWYRISDWSEDGANITVNASTLETLLDEYRFLDTIQLARGTTMLSAVRTLVANALPVRLLPGVTGTLTGRSAEDNRLEALDALLTDWGLRYYVDDSAALVVAPGWNDLTDPAVTTLTDGESGTVVRTPTQGNRDGVYNAVRAAGEDTGEVAPVSAVEYLRTGPRRWNGPYGNVPYFYASPLLTTIAQCRLAAQTRLRNLQAIAAPVTIEAVPDPRIELGDVIALTYRGTERLARIDAVSLPLTADGGAMELRGHEIRREQTRSVEQMTEHIPETLAETAQVHEGVPIPL